MSTGLSMAGERSLKKTGRKRTYPPPADGLRVRFLCKSRCDESTTPAQASRGVAQGRGNCTTCKLMQKNVSALHSERRSGTDGGKPRGLGPLG